VSGEKRATRRNCHRGIYRSEIGETVKIDCVQHADLGRSGWGHRAGLDLEGFEQESDKNARQRHSASLV
jgi:hypothetical protein